MKKRFFNRTTKIIIAVLCLLMFTGCGETEETEATEEPEKTIETGETENRMEVPEKTSNVIVMGNDGEGEAKGKDASLKEKAASMKITYRFDENTEILDGATISGWLETLADGSVSVNEAAAKEYVAGLASRYDTFGRNRSFKTHSGEQITVAGGDYGYWMDRVSTRKELIAQILKGESAELTPVYYCTAPSYDVNDIGDSYVEVNIGDQHLWVYKNGQLVNETDFVSGGLFKGNSTPEGTYSITYKERDATLVGEGYQSSVKYWMPFNGNIGLHDASWRDSFGGHIYYMSGSHGCVNLPTAKAAEIFDQVEKGEAVVVYGSISKEQAMSSLNMDDKAKAAQKGYISMTPEIQAYILQQQGFDAQTAAALAAAQQVSANTAPVAQTPVDQTAQQAEAVQPAQTEQTTDQQAVQPAEQQPEQQPEQPAEAQPEQQEQQAEQQPAAE